MASALLDVFVAQYIFVNKTPGSDTFTLRQMYFGIILGNRHINTITVHIAKYILSMLNGN